MLDLGKAPVTGVPRIVEQLCLSCRTCVARTACRSKAILQIDAGEPPFIDGNRCYGCHLCIPACPQGAIVLNGQRVIEGLYPRSVSR